MLLPRLAASVTVWYTSTWCLKSFSQIPNLYDLYDPKSSLGRSSISCTKKKYHTGWLMWNESSCKIEEQIKASKRGLQHMLQQHIKQAFEKKIISSNSTVQTYSLLVRSVSVWKIKLLLKLWRNWVSDNGEIQSINHRVNLFIHLEKFLIRRHSLLKEYRDSAAPSLLSKQSEDAPLNPVLIKFSLNANLHNVILKRLISLKKITCLKMCLFPHRWEGEFSNH